MVAGHGGGRLAALIFRCAGHLPCVWGHFCSGGNKNGMRTKGESKNKTKGVHKTTEINWVWPFFRLKKRLSEL
jgi:hypothetical protein